MDWIRPILRGTGIGNLAQIMMRSVKHNLAKMGLVTERDGQDERHARKQSRASAGREGSEVDILRRENMGLRQEVELMKKAIWGTSEELRRIKAETAHSKQELEKTQREMQEWQRTADHWKQEFETVQQSRDEWQSKEKSARMELQQARRREEAYMKERETMTALLETRRVELQAAQSYFNSADVVSESDVVRLVRNLNAEIFQAVKLLAESFHAEGAEGSDEAAVQQTRDILGQEMTALLLGFPHQDDTVLLEIALQAAIVNFTARIISQWDLFGMISRHSDFEFIRRDMLQKESQSVAGRWRALTHRYLSQGATHGQLSRELTTRHLTPQLSDILVVAGGSRQLEQTVTENLDVIVRTTLELRRTIGEVVVGSDYVISLGRPGDDFSPERMEDAYRTKKATKAGVPILCPSELGLQRLEKDTETTLREVTLVKPKVVLETALSELGLVDEASV